MFRVGQEIVCIVAPEEWFCCSGRSQPPISMPQKDEIYHVAGYALPFIDGSPAIYLTEFPGGWNFDARGFRPLIKVEDFMTIEAQAPETVGA